MKYALALLFLVSCAGVQIEGVIISKHLVQTNIHGVDVGAVPTPSARPVRYYISLDTGDLVKVTLEEFEASKVGDLWSR